VAPAEVLVVDDDEQVRERLRWLLESAGYQVRTASDGLEALGELRAQYCPLLLTDSVMPTMSGQDLCRAVRAIPMEGYVYTIMLSIRDSTEDIVAGLSDGADDYISKRAGRAEILARLYAGRRIAGLERLLRQRLSESRQLSNIDAHTGAYNMRHVRDALRRELERSTRYGHSLSVLLCWVQDPDAGELAAPRDHLLRDLVVRISALLRDGSDWIARWRDDQLLIVLPETAAEPALATARLISASLESRPLEVPAGESPCTVAIGMASADVQSLAQGVSVERLLEAAEDCLLESSTGNESGIVARDVVAPTAKILRLRQPLQQAAASESAR
jgi:diguanylate cyclase (GGDEF)-like protein